MMKWSVSSGGRARFVICFDGGEGVKQAVLKKNQLLAFGVVLVMTCLLTACGGGKKGALLEVEENFEDMGTLYAQSAHCGGSPNKEEITTLLNEYATRKGADSSELASLQSTFNAAIELEESTRGGRACDDAEKAQVAQQIQDKLNAIKP